mgnify:CR=1 FL=1
MKKSEKILIVLSMVLVLTAIGLFLYFEVSQGIAVGFGIVSLIGVGIISIIMFSSKTTIENPFERELYRILKTYDAVLVNSTNLPNLNDRDIVVVSTIRDLIDAQATVRKQIYYNKAEDSCSFVLLSEKEANVFILKASENVTCKLEEIINERKSGDNKEDMDHKLLDGIDKTTVIQLDNQDEYKVSPIREKENNDNQAEKKIEIPKSNSEGNSIRPIEEKKSDIPQIMPISNENSELPKMKE